MLGVPHLANVENTQSSFGGDVVDFLLSSVGMTLTEVTDIEFRCVMINIRVNSSLYSVLLTCTYTYIPSCLWLSTTLGDNSTYEISA